VVVWYPISALASYLFSGRFDPAPPKSDKSSALISDVSPFLLVNIDDFPKQQYTYLMEHFEISFSQTSRRSSTLAGKKSS